MRAGQGSRSAAQNTQLPFGNPNNIPQQQTPGYGFGGQTLGQGNGGYNQSIKMGGGNFGGAPGITNNNNGFFK